MKLKELKEAKMSKKGLKNMSKRTKVAALGMSMLLLLSLFSIIVGNTIMSVGAAGLSTQSTLVSITASSTKIYQKASSSGGSLATAYKNSNYPYLGEQRDSSGTQWYQIRYSASSSGWVSSNAAQKMNVTSHQVYSNDSSLTRLIRPTGNTYLYSALKTSSKKVANVNKNNLFTVIDDGEGSDCSWYKVRCGSLVGWISRKQVTTTNCYTQITNRTFSVDNVPVIYLSPSRQTKNPYKTGNTNECVQMEKVAKRLKTILEERYLCKVYMSDRATSIGKNGRPMKAANLDADIYLAIHSNATAKASSIGYGTQAYYYKGCSQSRQLGVNLVNSIDAISPFSTKNSGIIDGMLGWEGYGYGEVRSPSAYNMISLLLEVQYHDNADSARWIINNTNTIATAIADGMCKTFNFLPKSYTTETKSTTTKATTTTTTATAPTVTEETTANETTAGETTASTASANEFPADGNVTNLPTNTQDDVDKTTVATKSTASATNSGTKTTSTTKTTKTSTTTRATTTSRTTTTKKRTTTTKAVVSGNRLTVTGRVLNVRNSAGTRGTKVLTQVKKGQTYNYTSVKTVNNVKWYYIKVSSSVSGWVCGKYVSVHSDNSVKAKSKKLRITASALNVRAQPSTRSRIYTSVRKNAVYSYTDTKRVNGVTWYKIKVNSSCSGWVSGKYIKLC